MSDQPLVIEPTYPHAKILESIGRNPERVEPHEYDDATVRNSFWSTRWRCEIIVCEHKGRIVWVKSRQHRADLEIGTIGASYAWGIEQEATAGRLLATLVKHHTFKQYMLTGMFMETSKRSGVTYVFRKLRPTLAIVARGAERMRVLAALCMHPIGYYQGTWGGAMCPTDDVIAHLMLMRGDERRYWARSNQHPAHAPQAGL